MTNSDTAFKKVLVRCSICNEMGLIRVLKESLKLSSGGVLCMPILDSDQFCDHLKYIYLDRNFEVRDGLNIDYVVEKYEDFNENGIPVKIQCPTCQKTEDIKIPYYLLNQKQFETIKITIPQSICAHHFIMFYDHKAGAIGYETIDNELIDLIEKAKGRKEIIEELTLTKLITTYGIYGTFNIFHAIIFNYPIYIINPALKDLQLADFNVSYNKEQIVMFFNEFIPEKYQETYDINFVESANDYNQIKVKEKNALIIDAFQNILQTPWKGKLKFEGLIIKRALELKDYKEQSSLLKHDYERFFKEVECAVLILENIKKKIYGNKLAEIISKETMLPKANDLRLSRIKRFIENRFSRDLSLKIQLKLDNILSFGKK